MTVRLVLIVLWTLPAMLIQAMILLFPGRGAELFARIYWRSIGQILGLRLTVVGQVAARRPVIFVANHCSWLDIVALGSVLPGYFVAKSAIAKWPFVNCLAWLGGTVFVTRSRATVGREQNQLLARLAKGDNIILFPESTTSDGRRVLPFSSSFLAIAEAPGGPAVQPVTIVYDGLDGLPVQTYDRPEISWYGDMDMVSHFNGIGRRHSLHATILLDPPIPPGTFAGRKALTAALEARLAGNAAALRQGRRVT